ncbi:hypothetical protein ALC53_01491 [Atta colombica]|uniref:Uncharacterized protein n=1 Tax=Atta colombica TaxID=520822 RepID=A0A195BVC9_9HYME|nr:hypothetical protein ALC53_01491 [Atta colombica]
MNNAMKYYSDRLFRYNDYTRCKRRSWRAGELYELAEIKCKGKKIIVLNLPPPLPHCCHNMPYEAEYSRPYRFPSSAAFNMAFASGSRGKRKLEKPVRILTSCITFCFYTIIIIFPSADLHTLAMWVAKNLIAYRFQVLQFVILLVRQHVHLVLPKSDEFFNSSIAHVMRKCNFVP